MKIDTVVSGIKNLVNNEWLRRTGKALLYALHVVVHPFDGFWDLKNEKRGTASAATIIVILVLMTRLLSLQFTSFQFMEVNWEKINIWMEMAQILLPLTKPAIVTVAVLKGVGVYNEYYNANLYLQSNSWRTISTALYSFSGPFKSSYNIICAGVLLTLIPSLIIFLFFQKQVYAGLANGSVKG